MDGQTLHACAKRFALELPLLSPRSWPSLAYHQNRALNPTL